MKRTYLLLGVILAVLAINSIVIASTSYDIVQGLYDNILNTNTGYAGVANTQVGNDGWTYRVGPRLYPWEGTYGASYSFPATITTWPLMGWQHAAYGSEDAYGWSAQTTGGYYGTGAGSGTAGYICNSDETAEQLMGASAGTTVGFRNGWTYNNDDQIMAVWTAPIAGNATASFTCYAAGGIQNGGDNYSGSGAQFHLGLYHNGTFAQQLSWVEVFGTVNTGAGHGVALSASTAVSAGDSVVLIARSDDYHRIGNVAQENAAASGGISLSQTAPGSITGRVTSSLGGNVGGVTVGAGAFQTSTASDGTYTIVGVDPNTYTVTAHKSPGFIDNQVTGVVVNSGANTANVNIVITPWGTISGTVSDISGAVAGATVSTDPAYPGGFATTTTDTTGHYSLSGTAGSYTVYAKAANHVDKQVAGIAISDATNTPLNITLVQWGKLAGTVSGPSGVLGGVTVQCGAYTATTAADGTYSVFVPAGTYTVTAGLPGYETGSQTNVVLTNDTTTTQNFTLGLGAVLSGTVTNALPPNAPIAGVTVASGPYSTTTNSAGAYSVRVTRGSYTFFFTKAGYVGKSVAVNVPNDTTQNVSMLVGWDFASDMIAANPNGVWSYGMAEGSAGAFTPIATGNIHTNYAGVAGIYMAWPSSGGHEDNGTMFMRNTGSTAFLDTTGWLPVNAWREPQKVITSPGRSWGGMTGDERTVARFTTPNTGYYTVTARFAGETVTGATNGVAVRRNAAYLFGDPSASPQQVNGFVGRSDNGYTDSLGAQPVLTFGQSMDLTAGDTLDAIVAGVGSGWSQVDLTVAQSATIIKGRVTSDLPGNPPVVGAQVQASGNGPTYTAVTDLNGNYSMSVRPDAYDIETFKGGYANGLGSATVAADQTVTTNIVMYHKGTWDVAVDFSTAVNPNGQWTYGWYEQVTDSANAFAGYNWHSFTDLHSGEVYSHEACPMTYWINNGFHAAWLGKNYGASPAIGTAWGANPKFYYIEPGDLSIQSGDAKDVAAFRWTSPGTGAYDIYCRVFNQCGAAPQQGFCVLKNGTVLARRLTNGFIGTNAAGYSDSIGPGPAQVFQLTIPINSGDTVDFAHDFDYQTATTNPSWQIGWGDNTFPPYSLGISIQVSRNTTILQCNTVSDLKNALANQPVGTPVMMLAPMKITAAANRYLDYATYVESDDRSQAFKMLGDANTTVVPEGWYITFSATVQNDPADSSRKVLQIVSINSQSQSTQLQPLGMGSKAINTANPSARDKFVRVFGIVKSAVANTNPSTNTMWPYEYYIINDGGQDLKVKMDGQFLWMNDPTPLGAATVGHYIAVKGIVIKEGTDMVVFPRGYGSGLSDVDDYLYPGATGSRF